MARIRQTVFPEGPPPIAPADLHEHLIGMFQNVANSVRADQLGIEHNLRQIKTCKSEMRFLKTRIVVTKKAMLALGEVKEK